MSYSGEPWDASLRHSPRRWWGLGFVALLHVLLGWALVSGLARKVVEVVRSPVHAKIIEETRLPEPPPPAPPPPKNLPPPPPQAPPPPLPAFVPPAEVVLAHPPAPSISTTPVAPVPAEIKISPAAPVVAAPPAAAPAPVAAPVRTAAAINFNVCTKPEYTSAAYDAEAEGVTVVSYTMDVDGHIMEAHVERSAGPTRAHKQLDRATLDAVLACKGRPATADGRPERASSQVSYRWSLER